MRSERTVIFIALLVGSILRLSELGRESLWLDEFTTLEVARRSVGDILAGVGFDRHTPPLYYLLMHGWLSVVPQSEFFLRLPAAIFDLLNIVLIAYTTRLIFPGVAVGLVSLLYAVSPFAIYYAQEARMYSLVIFEVLGALWLLGSIIQEQRRLSWYLLFALLAVVGCYTHYYFCLFLGALAVVGMALLQWQNRSRAYWIGTLLLVALCYLPWIRVVFSLVGAGGQHFRSHFWLVFPYTLFRFVFGYAVLPITEGYKSTAVQTVTKYWWAYIPVLLAVAVAASQGVSRAYRVYREKFALVVIAPLLVILAALVLSLKAPMLSERYLSCLYPFAILLVAMGATSRPFQAFLLFTSCVSTSFYFFNEVYGKAQWRDVGAQVQDGVAAGDLLIVSPAYLDGVLKYYLGEDIQLEESKPLAAAVTGTTAKWLIVGGDRVPPSSGHLWLIESADTESLVPQLSAIGWNPENTQSFPKENGIHLTQFSR